MTYLERMKRRISGDEVGVPNYLADKIGLRNFASSIGVRSPEILSLWTGLDFDFTALPSRFVLKPVFGSTSMGVFLVEKDMDGGLINLVTGLPITVTEIVVEEKRICDFFKQSYESARFILEELIVGSDGSVPPHDVRFYAFQGEIGLIIRETHMGKLTEASYFGPGFLPLEDVESKYSVSPNLASVEKILPAVTPPRAAEMLAVARRVSVAVPTPFARIDLYSGAGGVYLGEVTLYPGTFYYQNRKLMSASEDIRLGRLWSGAEVSLAGSFESQNPLSLNEMSLGLPPA